MCRSNGRDGLHTSTVIWGSLHMKRDVYVIKCGSILLIPVIKSNILKILVATEHNKVIFSEFNFECGKRWSETDAAG